MEDPSTQNNVLLYPNSLVSSEGELDEDLDEVMASRYEERKLLLNSKESVPAISEKKKEIKRVNALDALRGYAMFAMILASLVPSNLPAWMYHAQEPPPYNNYDPNISGITWVDVVFPTFLFSMGAAIPLAMSRRMKEFEKNNAVSLIAFSGGSSYNFTALFDKKLLKEVFWLIFQVLERGFFLFAFAVFDAHFRQGSFDTGIYEASWLALFGFLLFFPMYIRFQDSWVTVRKRWVQWSIRGTGWIGMILMVALSKFKNPSHFSLYRSDIIILVLTNCYVAAALIWMVSRNKILFRYAIMGLLVAFRVSANYPHNDLPYNSPNWIQYVWNNSPLPWLSNALFFQYLCIVLPATVVGDALQKWLNSPESDQQFTWHKFRFAAIGFEMLLLFIAVLIGFDPIITPQEGFLWTCLLCAILCFTIWQLLRWPSTPTEHLLHDLFTGSLYWFWMGLLLEPYPNGIHKDPSTISYYFVTYALSVFILILFTVIVDCFQKPIFLKIFIMTGQNPMITYAGINGLIYPLLVILHLRGPIDSISSPGWGCLVAVILDIALAIFTMICTYFKIFWRT